MTTDNVTDTAVDVIWATDEAADSVVNYGTTTSLGSTASLADLVTSHSVGLSGLAANTTYYFEVVSTDGSGNAATDNNSGLYYTFTTMEAPTQATTAIVDSISYAREGGKNADKHLLVTIAIVDELANPVAGAAVSIELSVDGSLDAAGTGTTGSNGTVTFSRKNAANGCYTTEVTGVTATGLTWNRLTPSNSEGGCASSALLSLTAVTAEDPILSGQNSYGDYGLLYDPYETQYVSETISPFTSLEEITISDLDSSNSLEILPESDTSSFTLEPATTESDNLGDVDLLLLLADSQHDDSTSSYSSLIESLAPEELEELLIGLETLDTVGPIDELQEV